MLWAKGLLLCLLKDQSLNIWSQFFNYCPYGRTNIETIVSEPVVKTLCIYNFFYVQDVGVLQSS